MAAAYGPLPGPSRRGAARYGGVMHSSGVERGRSRSHRRVGRAGMGIAHVAGAAALVLVLAGCASSAPAPTAAPSTSPQPEASVPPAIEDSCSQPSPAEQSAPLEDLAELSERMPTPDVLGADWSHTVYDRGLPCLPFTRDGCTTPAEYDFTIDDEHRLPTDFAAPGARVLGISINAELHAEEYVQWMAERIDACPMGEPVRVEGPGAPDAVTTLSPFDEVGELGTVSVCRRFASTWDAETQRSDTYMCHAASGEIRVWFALLADQAAPIAPGAAAEAIRNAAEHIFDA